MDPNNTNNPNNFNSGLNSGANPGLNPNPGPTDSQPVPPPAPVFPGPTTPELQVPADPQSFHSSPQPQAVVSPNFTGPQPQVSPPPTGQQPAVFGAPSGLSPQPNAGKKSLKALVIALLAIFLVGGGTAAAYFGVVVPNRPQNVLKSALENTLQKKQASFTGTLNTDPANGTGGIAAKTDLTGSFNTEQKAGDVTLNFVISGVNFSVQARLVDGNVYLKVGDLSTITGLIGSISPNAAAEAKILSSQLSNQWIVVDSTLLKEAKLSCVTDTDWSLTKADVQLLEKEYGKYPFATIVSSGTDTVDGKKAERITLSLDDDKMSSYFNDTKGLQTLSLLKSLSSCDSENLSKGSIDKSLADHDHTPLTVWVDKKSKLIVQVASQSTAQDAKKANVKASGKIAFSYPGNVSISAPANAKPAIQVLTQLESSLGADSSGLDFSKAFNNSATNGSTLQ